jgi:hypothetical protein
LNQRIAAKNDWREFATRALKQASDEYLEHLKRNNPEAYERAVAEKQKRAAREALRPLPLRSTEGKRLLDELEKLKDEELLARYYYGRKPGKIPKKMRTKYPTLLEMIRELAKK